MREYDNTTGYRLVHRDVDSNDDTHKESRWVRTIPPSRQLVAHVKHTSMASYRAKKGHP